MLVLDTCALLHLTFGRTFSRPARDLLEVAVQRRQALVPAVVAAGPGLGKTGPSIPSGGGEDEYVGVPTGGRRG